MDRPRVNDLWVTNNFVTFRVTEVKSVNNENWIYYRREHDNAEFNCLEGAFLERFTRHINDQIR